MVTFLSTVLLDVDYGLYIGIGVSILVVVIKDQFCLRIVRISKYRDNFADETLVRLNESGAKDEKVRNICYIK